MGELPYQGFKWVTFESFGSELVIDVCHPSKNFMVRERDHQVPGVDGPAKDGL